MKRCKECGTDYKGNHICILSDEVVERLVKAEQNIQESKVLTTEQLFDKIANNIRHPVGNEKQEGVPPSETRSPSSLSNREEELKRDIEGFVDLANKD